MEYPNDGMLTSGGLNRSYTQDQEINNGSGGAGDRSIDPIATRLIMEGSGRAANGKMLELMQGGDVQHLRRGPSPIGGWQRHWEGKKMTKIRQRQENGPHIHTLHGTSARG